MIIFPDWVETGLTYLYDRIILFGSVAMLLVCFVCMVLLNWIRPDENRND
ncbi:hypothetical protein [Larkinella sp. C7]|jgi:hypothetical protein|nr:hypothetical protein [Larkinella sp. C7]